LASTQTRLSSFHGNHVPKAWIKAKIFRFETLCTFESDFNDATNFLCAWLAERGYPLGLLKRLSIQYSWSEVKRLKALPKEQNSKEVQATQQKGCILSAIRTPGTKELIEKLQIDPKQIDDPYLRKIYPESVMTVYKNAPNMRSHLPDHMREQHSKPSHQS
jgi:ribosomal protein S15P/S13E